MQSAAAYRQVTPEESMECAKCALEQGMHAVISQRILLVYNRRMAWTGLGT